MRWKPVTVALALSAAALGCLTPTIRLDAEPPLAEDEIATLRLPHPRTVWIDGEPLLRRWVERPIDVELQPGEHEIVLFYPASVETIVERKGPEGPHGSTERFTEIVESRCSIRFRAEGGQRYEIDSGLAPLPRTTVERGRVTVTTTESYDAATDHHPGTRVLASDTREAVGSSCLDREE